MTFELLLYKNTVRSLLAQVEMKRLAQQGVLPAGRVTMRLAAMCLILASLVFVFSSSNTALAAAQPVRISYGFDREFPPFSYENPGGQPTGFEVELVQAIFQGTNAVLAYRPLQWDRIGLELSAGTVTLTTGMVQTEQRSRLYLFSKLPTFPLQIRLFTKIYNRFPSAVMLRGQPVAVEQGSYQHRLLERMDGMNIKTYQNRLDGLRALFRDEVSAYCAPVQNTYYYINKLNYGAITTVGTPLGITEMRIAVNRGRGDVQRMVDEGMARVIASGEYDRLYRKWFVRELTTEEQTVMLSTAITAAVPAYSPYSKAPQGAAVLTATGKVYSACTVDNADRALTVSALRGAVSRAIADGEYELRAAIIVSPDGTVQSPTPAEMQTLYEFAPGTLLILPAEKGMRTEMVKQVLKNPKVEQVNPIQTE